MPLRELVPFLPDPLGWRRVRASTLQLCPAEVSGETAAPFSLATQARISMDVAELGEKIL